MYSESVVAVPELQDLCFDNTDWNIFMHTTFHGIDKSTNVYIGNNEYSIFLFRPISHYFRSFSMTVMTYLYNTLVCHATLLTMCAKPIVTSCSMSV